MRWSEYLAGFNYTIRYRPGKLGAKPDALTRRTDVYPSREGVYAKANAHNIQTVIQSSQLMASFILDTVSSTSLIREGIQHDEFAVRQISLLHSPSPPAHLGSAGPDAHYTLSAQGDLLWKGVLYVPDHTNLRLLLLQSCHDHHLAGHPGVTKTVQVLRRRYYWPNMSADVYRYVRACASCRRNKTVRHKPYGPLRFLPIPERPWSSISMDFIEWLPVSQGHDTILVVVDRLTKMALFIPTHSNDDAPRLARHFLEHVFSKHGTPSDIVSDRGKHFVSRFWASLCTLLGIQSNLSTAYHPETDRQTKHTNQILEQYLRMYINYEQDDWATLLPYAKFTYNNTPQSATGVSPFFANKGYHPSIEVNVEQVSSSEAAQMAEELSDLHAHLRKQLRITITAYEQATDNDRLAIPPFRVGEYVWLDARNIYNPTCKEA